MMVLPALVAALGGASAASPGPGWPPGAWDEGDLSDLSLVELALLASDLPPTKQNRRDLERGLAPLEGMPPEHTEVTRVVLEGLAKARWHQERALNGLDDRQRAVLASADPDEPTPPGWDEVMAAVDHGELGKALLTLESASSRALAILQRLNAEPEPTAASALAKAMGLPIPDAGPGRFAAPPTEATVALVAQVVGGLDPLEQESLVDDLETLPLQAHAAVHTLLERLVPLATGTPTDSGTALVDFGVAVDDARDTLRIWSTVAMAAQLHHVRAGPGIQIPNADTDHPPLHFGVPRLRDPAATLPPPPGLAEALREVALALGDSQTARDAEAHVKPLVDALGPEAQDAVAQILHQTARYVSTHKVSALVPPPSVLTAHPDLLEAWGSMDDLPDPGSPEAQTLLAARPFLAAQLEAALAREDLMTAVQGVVAALAPQQASSPLPPVLAIPASGHTQVPCDQGRVRVPSSGPAYLHIDPCGRHDTWHAGDRAMLVIDAGGDDMYEGPYGAAPFDLGSVPLQGPIISPVAIHLDLGGGDIYDATGHDCVLGAVCDGGQVPPVALLVDWQGDEADIQNVFRSDDRSQGYVGGGFRPGTGLLVERIGSHASLSSHYTAGSRSQGAAGLNHGNNVIGSSQIPGVGALLRMVGGGTDASSRFLAGDYSQGSLDFQGLLELPAVAALINVAGDASSSPDTYDAGTYSQGATRAWGSDATSTIAGNTALFVDVVGSGGRSDDTYTARTSSRAFGTGAYFLDALLPSSVNQDGLVRTSIVGGPEDFVPNMPGPGDLPSEGLPTPPASGVDPSDPSVAVDVESTGPRASSNDTYVLFGKDAIGNGYSSTIGPVINQTSGGVEVVRLQATSPTLFLDLHGNDTYPVVEGMRGPGNNRSWVQPPPHPNTTASQVTGVDNSTLQDQDGDGIPYFFEEALAFINQTSLPPSDQSPDDIYPIGRRILFDQGSRHPYLNKTYAFVITLSGNTIYGTGFSSAMLLDLAGNDEHLGRTAAATGPTASGAFEASAQNLLSLSLDLEGRDVYASTADGSMGFGAGRAVGILIDMGGRDHYHGGNYTQGVGAQGGLGVLVDLANRSGGPEANRFRADGSPSQGEGMDNGVGILVADGDHNTFEDGGSVSLLPDQAPDEVRDVAGDPTVPVPGLHSNGGGASYNGGDNQMPTIVASDWSGSSVGHAVAGVPYTFTTTVRDDDEDRLDVCWTFTQGLPDEEGALPQVRQCRAVEGSGTVQVEHTWTDVPTDARDDGISQARNYNFDLTVTDSGGMQVRVDTPLTVYNDPPRLAGGLRTPPLGMERGREYAIQVPFVPGEDPPDPTAEAVLVDWIDEGSSTTYNATAVDWAKLRWGARIEIPLGFPPPPGFSAPLDGVGVGGDGLDSVVDDDPKTTATFTHTRQGGQPSNAPATVAIWFDGPRQVRQVGMHASRSSDGSAETVRLSLDALRADGSTTPVGIVTLETQKECSPCTWDLPDFPDVAGLLLRQIVPSGDRASSHAFHLGEVFARGPGATHTWANAGDYEIDYTVLDRYGGRNGTKDIVSILSDESSGPVATRPVRLLDVGGRGPARHVSLAANPMQPYTLTLEDQANLKEDAFCIDWGDNTEVDCGEEGAGIPNENVMEPQKTWAESGDHDVEIIYFEDGVVGDGTGGDRLLLTTVHVEEQAIDLRAGDDDQSMPLLFLTFETRTTWHEGLVDRAGMVTPYQAIVDAGGSDRYLGRVASSMPLPLDDLVPSVTAVDGIGPPRPSLVVDGGGDDAYLSQEGRTQAFAMHFGVSLLVDVGGDDVYVADDEAQAAATRGGVTALLSLLGGQDVFNPIHAGHPYVAAASPRSPDLWLDRPDLGGRPVGPGPDFVQGAAEDGVAILATAGGLGVFHAGSRSQGHGTHGTATIDHYVFPGADKECENPVSGIQELDPQVDFSMAGCLFGIDNISLPNPNNPGGYLCQGGNQQVPLLVPCSVPDFSPLLAFFANGPRYGPGLGALVRLEGPAFYHADSESQGSAGSAGRGLLLDLDGGSALLATERAQAFSVDGTAGTVVGGSSVLRLGSLGQATVQEGQGEAGSVTGLEGPEAGSTDALQTAILLTLGPRNGDCGPGACGPSGQGVERDVKQELSPRLPGPTVTVEVPQGPISHAGTEVVEVDLPDGEELRVVVFTIAYPGWSNGPDPTCEGAPLAAPALVSDDVRSADFEATLDLGALVGGTDPLLPAGCTEVHVFARQLPENVGGSQIPLAEWGHHHDAVLLLPPVRGMRLLNHDGSFSTNGVEPVAFSVEIPEPLATAASDPPEIGFRIMPGGQTSGFDTEFQSDGTLSVLWSPSQLDLAPGPYAFQARARWPGGTDWSSWENVAAVQVDQNAPTVSVEQISPAVRRLQDITAHGTASDPSGVDAVVFRLLRGNGNVVPVHNGNCHPNIIAAFLGVEEGGSPDRISCARLNVTGGEQVEWSAVFRPTPAFSAGDLTVQVNALDGGGAVGTWRNVDPAVILDSEAPRVTNVLTPTGFQAAGPSPEDGNSTVQLRVHLCDGATPSAVCTADGVDPETVSVSAARITGNGTVERVPLVRVPALDAPGGTDMVLGYEWKSEKEVPEGPYDLFIMARDWAGNLFDHNPGHPFPVDRTLPELGDPAVFLPTMTRPDGMVVQQQAIKQGDEIQITIVGGSDANPYLLAARIPGDDDPVAEVEDPWVNLDGQTLALTVPAGADRGTGSVDLEVEAIDLAGNSVVRPTSVSFAVPFEFLEEPRVDPRSDSARVSWTLSRALHDPGDGLHVVLQDLHGTHLANAVPVSPTGDAAYQVEFSGLQPGQDYQILLQMWDGANNTLEKVLPLTTLREPEGVDILVTTSEDRTHAGVVAIDGWLFAGTVDIRGEVSLHLGGQEGPPVPFLVGSDTGGDAMPVERLLVEASLGERRGFSIHWDSRSHVPDGVGSQVVDLYVQFDDGSTSWNDTVSLRIDNTPPTIKPVVVGPAPNNGWYNGTVVVRGVAVDDTQRAPPAVPGAKPNLRYRTLVDGDVERETDAVTIEQDGTHTVHFTISDGALPPNSGSLSTVVRVDRTLPVLQLESGLASPWTNQPTVPFAAEASDDGSGLDGFRVRVDNGPWTSTTDAPGEVSLAGLPDGEHWIDVEVHDQARNGQRKTLNVLLDREPPSLVDDRWVGWSQDGAPVLHTVVQDQVGGDGPPSGVDAIRFAPTSNGPWSAWTEVDVSGVFPVSQATNGGWLQLRDRAGNVGLPIEVDAPPGPDPVREPTPPSPALLGGSAVAPAEGGPDTRFTFSVRIRPLGDAFPDGVAVHIANQTHPMQAEGPILDDGGRIHTVTITLPPSRINEPHLFHVTANYGGQTVEGPVMSGPTVFAFGLSEPTLDDTGQAAPGPALGLLILLLIAPVLYHRRYRP